MTSPYMRPVLIHDQFGDDRRVITQGHGCCEIA